MAYSYSRKITCGTATGADQSNFPLLVKFDNSNVGTTFKTVGNGGHIQNTVTQSGGNAITMPADLIFSTDAAGASKIPWEVDYYDATNGVLWAWVKVSTLTSATNAVIYVVYGDPAVSTQQNTSTLSPSNVWDSNYSAVLHFPNGTTLSTSDSTANINNGTAANSPTATTGQIDGGLSLASASTQYVSLAAASSLNQSAVTYSAWVKATSFPSAYNTIVQHVDAAAVDKAQLYVTSAGKLACYVGATATVSYDGTGSNTLSTATWYHVALCYDSSNGLVGYVNGSSDGTASANGALNTTASHAVYIGYDDRAAGRAWNGVIDEVHISQVARSANWIATEYSNQNNPLTFNTIGAEVFTGANVAMYFSYSPLPVFETPQVVGY